MAPIISHFIPSLFLSRKLKVSGYNVVYLVENTIHDKLIKDNGFDTIYIIPSDNSRSFDKPISFFKFILNVLNSKETIERKNSIIKVLNKVSPEYILIDLFSSNDFINIFRAYDTKKVFFVSPMLSTHKVKDFPTINQKSFDLVNDEKLNSFKNVSNIKYAIIEKAIKISFRLSILLRCFNEGLVFSRYSVSFKNSNITIFKNIKELVLAPSELELSPLVQLPNQIYLGLCVDMGRTFFSNTLTNSNSWEKIRSLKNLGKKVVYVSFGTFFSTGEEYSAISNFILSLLESIKEDDKIVLILVIKNEIKIALEKHIIFKENYIIFEEISQLEILKLADVFITHGGLSSVKESIFFSVPMLVYPLDFAWDQNGNGLKIEFHGLGLAGNILEDQPIEIYSKLSRILYNTIFTYNVSVFSNKLKDRYDDDFYESFVTENFS